MQIKVIKMYLQFTALSSEGVWGKIYPHINDVHVEQEKDATTKHCHAFKY